MKNSLKNIENRKNEILIYINQHDFADVDTLTTRFGVSRVTIRKDLDQMAKEGLITRTYGGASKINSPSLITIQNTNNIASSLELTERKIAKAAADMIEENDIVLINSSLTASYVIEYLGNKHVTTEGRLSLTGMYASNTMSDIIGTKCIIGVRGISAASGVTCQVPEEAAINQLLIQHTSKQVIVIADSRKIGVRDSFSSSDIRSIDYLITDSNANPAQLSKIEAAGVKVQLVDPC